ncbi:hypothetical protein D3C71_2152500 [compost metagenome]
MVKYIPQGLLGLIPQLLRTHGVLRASGQFNPVFKSEHLIYVANLRDNPADFFFNLVWTNEDMCIILAERPNPHHPVQRS